MMVVAIAICKQKMFGSPARRHQFAPDMGTVEGDN